MLAIKNAVLVMYNYMIPDGVLLIEDEKIHAFGEARSLPIPEDCQVIDAEGRLWVPDLSISILIQTGGCFFRRMQRQQHNTT